MSGILYFHFILALSMCVATIKDIKLGETFVWFKKKKRYWFHEDIECTFMLVSFQKNAVPIMSVTVHFVAWISFA
jgi:hypothetical protein